MAQTTAKGKKMDMQKSPGGLNGGGVLTTGQNRNFNALGEVIFCLEAWEDSVVVIVPDANFINGAAITSFTKGQILYGSPKSISVTSGKIVYYHA